MRSELLGNRSHEEACELWRTGNIPVSEKPPEELKNVHVTAVRFDAPSERQFTEKVINRIEELEPTAKPEEHMVKFALAVRNFHLYQPLAAARHDGGNEAERNFKFDSLQHNPDFLEAREAFNGIAITYGSLSLTEHGMIVISGKILLKDLGPLDALHELYIHCGLTPVRRDRFEMIIGRVVRYPKNQWLRDKTIEGLNFYLRHDISQMGVQLVTSRITAAGSLYDFLHSPPQRITTRFSICPWP